MRIYKAVIISIIVLAVGIAGFFVVREIVIRNTPDKIYDLLNTEITSFRSSDIEEITIYNNGIMMPMRQRSETTYDSSGNKKIIEAWYLIDEEDTKLSQRVVDGIVIMSSNLIASEIIERNAEDLEKYGLDGSYYVAGKTVDGQEYKVILGKMLYNREGYYAMLEGDNTVYAIAIYSANQLYTSRAELLDLNIFRGSLTEVEAFSLFKQKEKQFTVEAESVITWILTYPVESKADVSNSDEMIVNLLALSIKEFVDVDPDDLAVYGLDSPDYSVSITINGIEYSMLLGKEDILSNTFYAKMSDKNEVFTIDASTLTFLDNEALDMVYYIPFVRSIDIVKSVDIEIDGMKLLLEMELNTEFNVLDYKFNGRSINIVLGSLQTFGSFFFEIMIWVPIYDLEPEWEIEGEPYGRLVYTYIDDVSETIEYYERDEDSCYFVQNGVYRGLVVDKTSLRRDSGFPALVDLVISGRIEEVFQSSEQDGE